MRVHKSEPSFSLTLGTNLLLAADCVLNVMFELRPKVWNEREQGLTLTAWWFDYQNWGKPPLITLERCQCVKAESSLDAEAMEHILVYFTSLAQVGHLLSHRIHNHNKCQCNLMVKPFWLGENVQITEKWKEAAYSTAMKQNLRHFYYYSGLKFVRLCDRTTGTSDCLDLFI